MPLPATISGAIWPGHINGHLGPWESGGALYMPAYFFSGTMQLAMFKSADGGETWAEVDSADRITGVLSDVLSTAQVGTTLYILHTLSAGTGQVRKFECSTDQWVAAESGMATSPPALVANVSSIRAGFLCVRGDGNYVVFHNGATESVMGSSYRRIKYSRFQSGAWTINVRVDGGTGDQFHWDARAAQLGSSSRSHFFYTKSNAGFTLYQKSLTSGNTLNSESSVTGLSDASNGNYPVGNPTAYVDGSDTKIVVPLATSDSGGAKGLQRFVSADSPTLNAMEIVSTVNNVERNTSNAGAGAVDSITVYDFWPDSINDDLWHDNDAGSGTWGTDVEFADAVTIQGVSVGKITNAIGVLYNDNATVKYDKLQLTVPTKAPPAHLQLRYQRQAQRTTWRTAV